MGWQLLANGIAAGATYALVALGLTIIYSTVRFLHFAHGAVYVVGGYMTYFAMRTLGWQFGLAMLFAMGVTALLGTSIEWFVYRPIRSRGSSEMGFKISSLAVFLFLQSLVIAVWGPHSRNIPTLSLLEGYQLGPLPIWGTPLQGVIIITAVVVFVALHFLLRYTKPGKAIRAMASDPEMAEIVGVKVQKTRLMVFAIGSGLAGLAASLNSIDTGIHPNIGFYMLLFATVAVLIGGRGLVGAVVGALLLGLALHLGIWKIGTSWQTSIAVGLVLIFLVIRPQGLMGQRI